MQPLLFLDLFSGIGGFRLPLQSLGHKCIGFSEIDKYAIKTYSSHYDTSDEIDFGDISKIRIEDIPYFDLLTAGFPCFKEGTLITTDKGLVAIEEIKEGDMVLTHKNRFKKVLYTMAKTKEGIYKLKVQGSPETFVTEEHPYYVREMKNVWDNSKRTYVRVFSEPQWKPVKDLTKNDFIGFAMNTKNTNPRNITKEEAWLIGRYIADGYIRNNKRKDRINSYNHQVVFCIGKEKINNFMDKIKNYNVGITEERTVYKCRIINEKFMHLCLECNKGADNKIIPPFIMDLPADLLKEFLEGYMSGDGSSSDRGFKAISVSKKLIYQLGQVVQKVYKTPYSISHIHPSKTKIIEGRTVNQKPYYELRFNKEVKKQNNAIFIDNMLWCPIRELEYIKDFKGVVYNLEVEDDNSYVANNCTVHNCQAFSIAGHRRGFEDTRGTLFFQVARILKGKQPKYFILENVKGLISHDKPKDLKKGYASIVNPEYDGKRKGIGKTLKVIEETLVECGYNFKWQVLNTKENGLPQHRERIIFVGQRKDLGEFNYEYPDKIELKLCVRDLLEDNVDRKYYLSEEMQRRVLEQLANKRHSLSPTEIVDDRQSDLRIYEDISPTVRAERQGLYVDSIVSDNAVLHRHRAAEIREYDGISPTLMCCKECEGYIPPIIKDNIVVIANTNPSGNGVNGNVYDVDGVSPTLTTNKGEGFKIAINQQAFITVPQPSLVRKYEVDKVKLQNVLRTHKDKLKLTNKKIAEVLDLPLTMVEHWFRTDDCFSIPDKDIWTALKSLLKINTDEFDEAIMTNEGISTAGTILYPQLRKLTPKECLRLQGFPDELYYDAKAAGVSDTQLYKQAGNAVSVPVIKRVIMQLEKCIQSKISV
jgi:DNA-cytosine methyltransferase